MTTCGGNPSVSKIVAALWRRSWIRIRGNSSLSRSGMNIRFLKFSRWMGPPAELVKINPPGSWPLDPFASRSFAHRARIRFSSSANRPVMRTARGPVVAIVLRGPKIGFFLDLSRVCRKVTTRSSRSPEPPAPRSGIYSSYTRRTSPVQGRHNRPVRRENDARSGDCGLCLFEMWMSFDLGIPASIPRYMERIYSRLGINPALVGPWVFHRLVVNLIGSR